MPHADPNDIVFAAIAFAARAHHGQLRKDKHTPYVSHVYRVAMTVRHVFGFDDPQLLAAAILHDTIEDTTTDCDDIIEKFGEQVARWVVALTKDKRLADHDREKAYCAQLVAGGWPVCVLKLADVYDNLGDSRDFPAEQRQKTVGRARQYLAALQPGLTAESRPAFEVVQKRLAEAEKLLA